MPGVTEERLSAEVLSESAVEYTQFLEFANQGDWKTARNWYLTCAPELGCVNWECESRHAYKSGRLVSEDNGFVTALLKVDMTGEGDDLTFRLVPAEVKMIMSKKDKYKKLVKPDGEPACNHDGDMSDYKQTCGCCIAEVKIATRCPIKAMQWTGLKVGQKI